jgi:hypothetical protein
MTAFIELRRNDAKFMFDVFDHTDFFRKKIFNTKK